MCHHAMSSYQVVHSEVQPSFDDDMCAGVVPHVVTTLRITCQGVTPLMMTCLQVNRTQPCILGPRGHLAGEPLHLAGWIFQYDYFSLQVCYDSLFPSLYLHLCQGVHTHSTQCTAHQAGYKCTNANTNPDTNAFKIQII